MSFGGHGTAVHSRWPVNGILFYSLSFSHPGTSPINSCFNPYPESIIVDIHQSIINFMHRVFIMSWIIPAY